MGRRWREAGVESKSWFEGKCEILDVEIFYIWYLETTTTWRNCHNLLLMSYLIHNFFHANFSEYAFIYVKQFKLCSLNSFNF